MNPWLVMGPVLAGVVAVEVRREVRERRAAARVRADAEAEAALRMVGTAYVHGVVAGVRGRGPVHPADADSVREALGARGLRRGVAVAGNGPRAAVVRDIEVRWDEAAEDLVVSVGVDVVKVG